MADEFTLSDPTAVQFEDELEQIESFTGPSRVEKHIVDMVKENLEESRKRLDEGGWPDRWHQAIDMDNGATFRATVPGMSNLSIPVVKRSGTTLIQNEREGLFPGFDFLDFDPDSDSVEDEVAAVAQTALVRTQFDSARFVPEMVEHALPDFNYLGTTIVKTEWDRRIGVRCTHGTQQLPQFDELTGETVIREIATKERKGYLLFNGPRPRAVDLFSLFPSDWRVNNIEECEYVIETGAVAYDTIYALRRRDEKFVDEMGQIIIREEGRYRNVEDISRRDARKLPRTGNEEDTRDEEQVDGFLRCESHSSLDLGAVFRLEDGDGVPLFTTEEVIAFLAKFGLDEGDLAPNSGRWLIETLDHKHLLNIERNPYPFDQLPYDVAQFLRPVERCLYGFGLYDIAGGLQIAYNSVVSNTVDAETKAVAPQFLVDPSMIDTSAGSAEEQLEYRPYGTILVQPGGTEAEIIKPLAIPQNIIQEGLLAEEHLLGLIRDVTGAKAELQGAGGARGRATATQISTNEANAVQFVTLQNARFEDLIIEPVADKIAAMNQQFIVERTYVRVMNEQGLKPSWIDPIALAGKVRARARGTGELTNRIVRAQVLLNAIPILGPVMDLREAGRLILKTLRAPGNIDKLIPNPPPQQPGMPGQPAQPGQAAPQGLMAPPNEKTSVDLGFG